MVKVEVEGYEKHTKIRDDTKPPFRAIQCEMILCLINRLSNIGKERERGAQVPVQNMTLSMEQGSPVALLHRRRALTKKQKNAFN